MTSTSSIEKLVSDTLLPKWRKRCETLDMIDSWLRPVENRDRFPLSRRATGEHKELQKLSEAPWGAVVVAFMVWGYRIGYRNGFQAAQPSTLPARK